MAAEYPGDLELDNPFWRFSLAVYAAPAVAEECLALQQGFGADVNLLLFCAWMGTRAYAMDEAQIAAAMSVVAAWHDQVVRPLRGARQYVKTLSRGELEPYRTNVKRDELEAERIEQAMLFAWSKKLGTPRVNADRDREIAANVDKYIVAKAGSAAGRFAAPRMIEAAIKWQA